jgi:hypothetical protein
MLLHDILTAGDAAAISAFGAERNVIDVDSDEDASDLIVILLYLH